MDRLLIRANGPLQGVIPVSGAKNSALKLMVAAILTEETVTLSNMPVLADTHFMAQLLGELGLEIEWLYSEKTCLLRAASLSSTVAPYELVRKMRATFNVLGPLLSRLGSARVSLPGGCAIGARPVDLHLRALERMGAEIRIDNGYVEAWARRGLSGAHIEFPKVSVGATEHVMMAAVLARGKTILDNAACEPEIVDLAELLNAMGARVAGAGRARIVIDGVEALHGAGHRIMPDRIEAGAYAMAGAITGGDIVLQGVEALHMGVLAEHLRLAGVRVDFFDRDKMRVKRDGDLRPVQLCTEPWPGFPTDLQAPFMALMALARGQSVITETIFENRFMHVPELCRMGADIEIEGNRALVRGIASLRGAEVMATDLRASISLVVAGLVAEGETVINRLYHLDRGFERLEEKLSACGAMVSRQRAAAAEGEASADYALPLERLLLDTDSLADDP